ncbi:MAG: hypothetical protein B7Y74_13695 [Novosphingobium sp. 35-62-5]|nr:MAG: hypothetical protein B7Y74_13695 [Novosphingobium sp. 35-62-5]
MSLVHDHENTVPRPALILAGALVATTLSLTALVQVGVLNHEAVPAVEFLIILGYLYQDHPENLLILKKK